MMTSVSLVLTFRVVSGHKFENSHPNTSAHKLVQHVMLNVAYNLTMQVL